MTFKDYIEEALSLSLGKKYTRLSQGAYKHMYDSYFQGQNRKYYTFDASEMKLELGHTDENMIKFYSNFERAADIILSSEIYKAESNLSKLKNNPKFNNPKALESIESNINKLRSLNIVDFLKIDDYKNGIAIDYKNNQWKIGKVFTTANDILNSAATDTNLNEQLANNSKTITGRVFDGVWKRKEFKYHTYDREVYISMFSDSLDFFKKDPNRSGDLMIVISRHPYDIAGMSTGRGWRSCMNLEDGCNRHYVEREIAGGTIIAYLISANDRNIKNPLGRALIKRYNDDRGNMMLSVYKTYGSAPAQFLMKIKEILNDEINPKITGKTAGNIFHRNPYTYPETDEPEVINTPVKNYSDLIKLMSTIKGVRSLLKITNPAITSFEKLKLNFDDVLALNTNGDKSNVINKISNIINVDKLILDKIPTDKWKDITMVLLKDLVSNKEFISLLNSDELFKIRETKYWNDRPDSETLSELVSSKLRNANDMYYFGSKVDKEEQIKSEIMLKYKNRDASIINLIEQVIKPEVESGNENAKLVFNTIKKSLKKIEENNYNYFYKISKNISNYYNNNLPDVSEFLKPGMKVFIPKAVENEKEQDILDKIRDHLRFNDKNLYTLNIRVNDLDKLFRSKKFKVHPTILNWLEAKALHSKTLATKRKYYKYLDINSSKLGGNGKSLPGSVINPKDFTLELKDVGTDYARVDLSKKTEEVKESFRIKGKFGRLFNLIS